MIIQLFFLFSWYASLFFQSFLHHRYAAHGVFTTSRFWQRVFYVMAYIAMGPSYLSPWAYAMMHRMHHAHADTEKDPHSPKYDKNVFAMMWKTRKIYSGIYSGKIDVEEKYKKDVPNWKSFERIAHSWPSRLIWSGIYIYLYVIYVDLWILWLFLPIQLLMGPVHGALINWGAHTHGYTNFEVNDTSKNLAPFDFITMGEGYHNNHHKFPSRWRFAFRWFEFDATARIIQLFNWMKIIKLKRI